MTEVKEEDEQRQREEELLERCRQMVGLIVRDEGYSVSSRCVFLSFGVFLSGCVCVCVLCM